MADLVNSTGGITRLNTNNYQSWRSRIKSYLEGQDLWEVVNGNDTKPPKNAEQLQIWKVKAAKAMYVLKSTIEDWLLGRIRDDDTPNMVWDTFASLFLKTNDARLQYGVGDTDFTPVEVDMRVMRMDPELYKAAQQGDVEYIQRNRTQEVDSQDRGSDEFFLRRTHHGNNNILHIAARAGRDTFVAEALRHFPALSDQVNSEGDTPLLGAARFGHLQVVKKLAETESQIHGEMAATAENIRNSSQRDLEQGLADRQLDVPLINSEQGTTALHEALRNGHEDVARYLLKLKPEMATFHGRAGESPLFLAAESRCEQFMSDILRSKQPYSTKGPDGQHVLHAVRNCDGKIISELITQKPDLMRQFDKRGKAAIHYAIEADYGVLVDQMLEADATIALLPDAEGYTPLLRACSRGCWKVFQKMLNICPESIEARNHKGQNAVHLCKFRRSCELFKFFIIPEIRELLNVGDDEGNTPLHLAVTENAPAKAKFLLASVEIDFWAVNKEGLTALDIWETDWMNSNTQLQITRWMWVPIITRYKAQYGRRRIENKVSVEGRTATTELKPLTETLFLVATLIATVTFAAAFTMPGGFDTSPGNLGVAILVKMAALRAFILSDTIAMCCSITVLFLLMGALIFGNDAVWTSASISMTLLGIAFLATLVAFTSGIFAVIAPKALWVAILVCIMCCMATFALFLSNTRNLFPILIFPASVIVRWLIVEPIQQKLIKKTTKGAG